MKNTPPNTAVSFQVDFNTNHHATEHGWERNFVFSLCFHAHYSVLLALSQQPQIFWNDSPNSQPRPTKPFIPFCLPSPPVSGFLAIRVAHLLKCLTSTKTGAEGSLDINFLSSRRVTSLASLTKVQFEGTKAGKIDSFTIGYFLCICLPSYCITSSMDLGLWHLESKGSVSTSCKRWRFKESDELAQALKKKPTNNTW